MEAASHGEVTRLLQSVEEGAEDLVPHLVSLLYDELRDLAGAQVAREGAGHTLTPTALVHEAYVKLAPARAPGARDRAHFLAIASRAMRQVLVDHARSRHARKREGGWVRATLSDALLGAEEPDPTELLILDEALSSLSDRQRQVVECRVFGGMEWAEIALATGASERTVRRDWVMARAWLLRSVVDPEPERGPA